MYLPPRWVGSLRSTCQTTIRVSNFKLKNRVFLPCFQIFNLSFDHTHSHHTLTSAAAPLVPHGRPTPPSIQNRCSKMCGHQHLAPVQQTHSNPAALQTLPSVSTPHLIPSSSRPDSPSIVSIDSMIHSTDLESGNCFTPFSLIWSWVRKQIKIWSYTTIFTNVDESGTAPSSDLLAGKLLLSCWIRHF